MARQAKGQGEIVSPAGRQKPKQNIAAKTGIYQALKRSISTQGEKQPASVSDRAANKRLQMLNIFRYQELRGNFMRGKQFSNFRKARTCAACSCVGIDEDNRGKFARKFERFTHHVPRSPCRVAVTNFLHD